MSESLVISLARPEVRPLPAYNAGLSSDAVRQRYGVSDVVRLASNENPFGVSPAVRKALAAVVDDVGNYPDANCTALREAIAQSSGVAADRLVFGDGSEDLIKILCEVFLSPGDRVVTQRPVFGLHEIYPKMMGAEVELLELNADMGFDIDAWCAAVSQAPKIAFLPNPSNPVGCMMDVAQFARVLEATPQGTVLVVDEAYTSTRCMTMTTPMCWPCWRSARGRGLCCAPSPRPGGWRVCAWAMAWLTAPLLSL